MLLIMECNMCGAQRKGEFIVFNGHVGRVLFTRDFGAKSRHVEEAWLCADCYEELASRLNLHGGRD